MSIIFRWIRWVLNNIFYRDIIPLERYEGNDAADRSFYQSLYVDFKLNQGDKVLDVGCGEYPFPYATYLVDLYEGETTHRFRPLKRDIRPFKVCDIESLPFDNKEFDFVYCSHVLEHVKNPARACDELMRIGKRGFIETPTRMSDVLMNFTRLKDHHRWHINLLGRNLLFMEYGDREHRDTGCNDFFRMLHAKYKNPYQKLVHENRDLFSNMLLWEDRFYYYVFDKEGSLISTNKNDDVLLLKPK